MKEKKKHQPVHGSPKAGQPSKNTARSLSPGEITEWWGRGKWKNLFAPVDISTIVFYRILFGFIMLIEVIRYFEKGWIKSYWIDPKHHFTYWPFDFLKPLPGDGMYLLFYVLGILSVMIMTGFLYRVAITLFFFCFSYTFLLEQTRYMNHFYLVVIVSFIMIFIPASSAFSIDRRLFRRSHSETIPAWCLWLLRLMVGIPYFWGGVAKLNGDWLQGQPLIMWIKGAGHVPLLGPLLQYDWAILGMAYAGLILDLFIVPALLFRKTRLWGFLLILCFHLMNSQLFQIGIFPWFMIVATTLYFDPGWFRKGWNFLTGNSWPLVVRPDAKVPEHILPVHKLTLALLALWFIIQSALPLRHFFIPGSVHWTEEGHRYAWHMKLRTKRGTGEFKAVNKKTGEVYPVRVEDYLSPRQARKFIGKPYLVWQFCQIVKENYKQSGIDVAVYARVKATLNGRQYQQLIDSTVDLTSVPRPILPADWILPLNTPLEDRLDLSDPANRGDGGD